VRGSVRQPDEQPRGLRRMRGRLPRRDHVHGWELQLSGAGDGLRSGLRGPDVGPEQLRWMRQGMRRREHLHERDLRLLSVPNPLRRRVRRHPERQRELRRVRHPMRAVVPRGQVRHALTPARCPIQGGLAGGTPCAVAHGRAGPRAGACVPELAAGAALDASDGTSAVGGGSA
jgi:hypothetical protein